MGVDVRMLNIIAYSIIVPLYVKMGKRVVISIGGEITMTHTPQAK